LTPPLAEVIEPRLVPFLVALTGFLCVCDWLTEPVVPPPSTTAQARARGGVV